MRLAKMEEAAKGMTVEEKKLMIEEKMKTMTAEEMREDLTSRGCVCGKCEKALIQAFYYGKQSMAAKEPFILLSVKCREKGTSYHTIASAEGVHVVCCSDLTPIKDDSSDQSDPKKQEE